MASSEQPNVIDCTGPDNELENVLSEQNVVEWRESALQAAVLAPLLEQQRLEKLRRKAAVAASRKEHQAQSGASDTNSNSSKLRKLLQKQHLELAHVPGYSSRAVRQALVQITQQLEDIRPEDQDEANDVWKNLRLQQQFLLAHRAFRKERRAAIRGHGQQDTADTTSSRSSSVKARSEKANGSVPGKKTLKFVLSSQQKRTEPNTRFSRVHIT